MTPSARDVAVAMYSSIAARDFDRYFACLSDDVKITLYGSHRLARTFVGKDDIRTHMFGPVAEKLDGGLRLQIVNVIAEGNRAVLECEGEARSRDGRPYNNKYCFVVTVEDGKVVESHEYMDTELTRSIIG